MTKDIRQQVYNKYNGHCSYCGREIDFKDMQVDHIIPQRLLNSIDRQHIDHITNLNPSCRRCNHYKRASSLEYFRVMLKTIQKRVLDVYICKVAEDYGIIKIESWDGTFFFEKAGGGEK